MKERILSLIRIGTERHEICHANVGDVGKISVTAIGLAFALATGIDALAHAPASQGVPPPKPEPVMIEELPLPPTAPSDAEGACSVEINPRRTGCISSDQDGIIEGPAYLWDAKHVLLAIRFTGAPAAPDPANVFDGPQVIAVKTDGQLFANGEGWKCITCGVPRENREGANPDDEAFGAPAGSPAADWQRLDHPQAFPGDRKMIAGTNVVDCGRYKLVDEACTPDRIRIFPIRWNASADGSGPGGTMRELRLNPDGVHFMWSHMNLTGVNIDQHGLVGRLAFNSNPTNGDPLVPRYELEDVTVMTNSDDPSFASFRVDPDNPGRLIHNRVKGAIGEARGWTRDGRNAVGMGMPESGNVEMYITSLNTGQSERLTNAPGYADPILMSPDDRWFVVFDNRTVDRHMYYGAMRGIPPLTDVLTRMVMLSAQYGYRNGLRRFFQPILIDRRGDRGDYAGQQLNAGPGTPGSPSDPNWNARADPAWSPDGTNVVYWQALVTAPDCGGDNPLPCPVSTEPGGRHSRLMIARLTSRKPLPLDRKIDPQPIAVPWGTPYRPGAAMPRRNPEVPEGEFTMNGWVGGSAKVEVRKNAEGRVTFISANYERYTDDGIHVIDGMEIAERVGSGKDARIVWHSDLSASGGQTGTKKTSEPGGFVISAFGEPLQGELVTTIDGKTYRPPRAGT